MKHRSWLVENPWKQISVYLLFPKGLGSLTSKQDLKPLHRRWPTFKQTFKLWHGLSHAAIKGKTFCNAPNKFAWARVIPTLSDCYLPDCSMFLSFLMLTFGTISYMFTNCDRREEGGRDDPTSTPEPKQLGKAHTGTNPWLLGPRWQILHEETGNWPHWGTPSPKPHPRLQRNSSKSLVHFSKHVLICRIFLMGAKLIFNLTQKNCWSGTVC